jgi:hypothetical protein
MARNGKSDWMQYWQQFTSIADLENRSCNIDETLLEIEREIGFKLLSGDQMQIIYALEERIKELRKNKPAANGLQASLFD